MSTFKCESCGGDGNVTVAKVRPSGAARQSASTVHHYCRDCAKARGVPLRDRDAAQREIVEPALFTWAEVETYLTRCEGSLRHSPEVSDTVSELAAKMVEYCEQLPRPMPSAVRDAFRRLGVATTAEDASASG